MRSALSSLAASLFLGGTLVFAIPAVTQNAVSSAQAAPAGRGMGYGHHLGWGMGRGEGCGLMGMGAGHRGLAILYYPEGSLAFLKVELKITPRQTAQWNAFAHAVRSTSASMHDMWKSHHARPGPKTLPERLESHERMMGFGLETMRAVDETLIPLYNSFDADQKATAEALFMPCGRHTGLGWDWSGDNNDQ